MSKICTKGLEKSEGQKLFHIYSFKIEVFMLIEKIGIHISEAFYQYSETLKEIKRVLLKIMNFECRKNIVLLYSC